jgi:hypothetical protein
MYNIIASTSAFFNDDPIPNCFMLRATFQKMISEIPFFVILPVAEIARVSFNVVMTLFVILQFVYARKFLAAYLATKIFGAFVYLLRIEKINTFFMKLYTST